MTQEILKKAELISLLHGKNVHVLVVDDTKVVFSKNANIGYIQNETFYVKPDFFTGGKFDNAIYQQEIKMIERTFMLKTSQAILEKQDEMDRLNELLVMTENEVNNDMLGEYVMEAQQIAELLKTPASFKVFNEINVIVAKKSLQLNDDETEAYRSFSKKMETVLTNPDITREEKYHLFKDLLEETSKLNISNPDFKLALQAIKNEFDELSENLAIESLKKIDTQEAPGLINSKLNKTEVRKIEKNELEEEMQRQFDVLLLKAQKAFEKKKYKEAFENAHGARLIFTDNKAPIRNAKELNQLISKIEKVYKQ